MEKSDKDLEEAENINRRNNISVVTKYQYDLLGNIEKIIDGEGNVKTLRYNENNQLEDIIDEDGYLTKRAYNPLGQLEKIKYEDGREVKLKYNSLRQLVEIEDWLGKTEIVLDKLGRTKV